jgi:hypothetical protein
MLATGLAISASAPAIAMNGEILINQGKALAGNVTAGDAPGFPVTLSRPGAYRLTGSLQVPANKDGISIAAESVTLDLNGFQITGRTLAANAVVETAPHSGATIRNGTIAAFKGDAIRSTGMLWTVEDMRVFFNGGHGITAGHLLTVRDSVLWNNKLTGITAVNWASILNSTVVASGSHGIDCDNHCLISGNMISQNGIGSTAAGVNASLSTVLGNTISGNGGFGIQGGGTGYGNNTLTGNNFSGGGDQVSDDLMPLQPNACTPVC